MHLDEERVQRLLHGELSAPAEESAREHIAACSECRRAVSEVEREEEEVHALLRHLDRPVPRAAAGAIAARAARARDWGRLQMAAGFLIALAIAGAAYAVPGSPLPVWVRAVADWIGDRREPSQVPSPARAPDAGVAGISVFPGRELLVVFTTRQAEGHALVSLTDGTEVVVHAPIGAATFTSETERLVIDNRGPSAVFQIQIPRAAPRVEIQVDGKRLFLKEGSRVTAGESTAATGSYVLPLAP